MKVALRSPSLRGRRRAFEYDSRGSRGAAENDTGFVACLAFEPR